MDIHETTISRGDLRVTPLQKLSSFWHSLWHLLGFSGIALLFLLAILLIALPLASLAYRVYQEQAWQAGADPLLPQAIALTFQTTAVSLILILLLGTPLAYVLSRGQFWGRRMLNVLVELPIVLPPAVAGFALLVTFGRRGLLGPTLLDLGIRLTFTRYAVILAQTFVAMPFYVRAAQVGFNQVDREIEAAALVDGASRWMRFWRVTLPLSSRALLTGALMSWARALGEFGATILFAGSAPGRTQTMTLLIYKTYQQNIPAALWTALILIALAASVLFVVQVLSRENRNPSS
ncbi:MAG: molybdate ABC transporter permease subunit [Chloroflexi bacterium]|nr:molybdate ABC transporter permease subunit [Chloroflexota bacterium]